MHSKFRNYYSAKASELSLLYRMRMKKSCHLSTVTEFTTIPEVHGSNNQIAIFRDMDCLLNTFNKITVLSEGKKLHAHMLITGTGEDTYIETKLLKMYFKCGSEEDARHMFDKMSIPNAEAWDTMIKGCVMSELWQEAIEAYYQMQRAGMKPNKFTIPSILKACACLAALQAGKDIHDYIIRIGLDSDGFVMNSLLAMYAKCGCIEKARHVFDKMSQRGVVSWNAMIAGYLQNGDFEEALHLFNQMQIQGMAPNCITWTSFIAGYAQHGYWDDALEFFGRMLKVNVEPISNTLASVLSACAYYKSLERGKEVHSYSIKTGFELHVYVRGALVDMYARCGCLEVASQLFHRMRERNVVSWTVMMAGYVQHGFPEEALKLFSQMKSAGVKPNSVTMATILPACAHLTALLHGKEIHGYAVKSGLETDIFVGSALIDMYAKCKSILLARNIFDRMTVKNVVSWNAIIAGYIQNEHTTEALNLFRHMQLTDVQPTAVTIASILSVCGHLATLQQGKEIHDYILRNDLQSVNFVVNALIDMYAKCGNVELAHQLFDKMSQKNKISWTTMIAGYGMHGLGEEALTLFRQMQLAGLKPDHITFVAVLSACSHAGLLDEGCQYFRLMETEYGITPTLDNYACVVDLLGRAGRLDEAHDFIKCMPFQPSARLWGSLLGACRIHCNVELGEYVAAQLFELDPDISGFYILLSHIYANAGRWDDVAKVRALMESRNLTMRPGCSWIEVKNRVQTFVMGEQITPIIRENLCNGVDLDSIDGRCKVSN